MPSLCYRKLQCHIDEILSSGPVLTFHFFTDDKVPTELKKAIMQARMDKKLTQAQLAQV